MSATVEDIKALWAEVDELANQHEKMGDELDNKRWRLAEWLHDASSGGSTQRKLADEVGKPPADVNHFIHIWRDHKDQPEGYRQPFRQLLDDLRHPDRARARLPDGPTRQRAPRLPGKHELPPSFVNDLLGAIRGGIGIEVLADKATEDNWQECWDSAEEVWDYATRYADALLDRFEKKPEAPT